LHGYQIPYKKNIKDVKTSWIFEGAYPGRRDHKCKDPEFGMFLVYLSKTKEGNMAGVE
jgi:hypothetical protein